MLKVSTIIALTALIFICTQNAMTQTKKVQLSQELLTAARNGNRARVEEIIKSDPSIVNEKNDAGETPIIAAFFKDYETVKLLVESGTKLNIFEATCLRKIDLVKKLLEENPELVNEKGYCGATALHFAAFIGDKEIVRLLLEKKAEVNPVAPGFGNPTPLHSAVANGNFGEIAEMLIEQGADVNAKQDGGLTPLHETVLSGNLKLAELLIGKGADINVKDDHGRTALTIAVEVKQEALAELLRRHGAKP